MSRKRKNKKKLPAGLDTSSKIRGESDLHFNNLPKKIKEPPELNPDIITDREAVYLAQIEQVKYFIPQVGDDIPRMALLLGVSKDRAKKLIDDVYNISHGIGSSSNAEQRRRVKKRSIMVSNRLIEEGFRYLEEGYEGRRLTPSEFKQISSVIKDNTESIAKFEGIGNTIIFEQFNQQTNINYSPAKIALENDKDKRNMLFELQNLLTQTLDSDTVDAEVVDD